MEITNLGSSPGNLNTKLHADGYILHLLKIWLSWCDTFITNWVNSFFLWQQKYPSRLDLRWKGAKGIIIRPSESSLEPRPSELGALGFVSNSSCPPFVDLTLYRMALIRDAAPTNSMNNPEPTQK